MRILLVAELQGLPQNVLITDDTHVRVVVLCCPLVINNDLLSLIDCHLLNNVCQQLHRLVWRKHFSTDRLLSNGTAHVQLRSVARSHRPSIQCTLHEFAALGLEIVAASLNFSQVRVHFAIAACSKQVRQLVHFELHFRDLEVDLFEGFKGLLRWDTQVALLLLKVIQDLFDLLPSDHACCLLLVLGDLLLQLNIEQTQFVDF